MGERRLHASGLVEIAHYDCRRSASGPAPEEWSARCEVAVPLRGVFVKHVAGRAVTCDVTAAATFDAGEVYRVSHPADGGDACLVLAPTARDLREVLEATLPARAGRERPFGGMALPVRSRAALELRLLHATLETPGEAEAVDERALRLLAALTAAVSTTAAPPARRATREAQRALAEAARQVLRERPAAPASIAEVAARLGCTPFHLARVFRRETGWSVRGYAMRMRLGAALERIADGEADLSRLAAELGFADHGHLTRRFRQAFGTTPSGFRRRLGRVGASRVQLPERAALGASPHSRSV